MKHTLHVIAVAILLVVALALLGLYYSQPFVKDFDFKKRIAFDEIEVVKTPIYSYDYAGAQQELTDETLQSASADVGTLRIANDGFFTKLVTLPYLTGCIELKESVDPSKVTLRQTQFSVTYQADGTVYYPGQKIELSTDDSKNFLLKADYQSYGVPVSEFTSGNIRSVSIYVSEKKEDNPLGGYGYGGYYNDYGYSSSQCEDLKRSDKPAAEILIG